MKDNIYCEITGSNFKFYTKNGEGWYVPLRDLQRGTYKVTSNLAGVVTITGNSENYVLQFDDSDDAAEYRVGH